MKKYIFIITIALLTWLSIATFAQQNDKEIGVTVDGLKVSFDTAPIIKDNRTLVPFRAIAEALNINVLWEDETKTINANSNETYVVLQINNMNAYVNDNLIELEVPPIIMNDRTLIPLRFFSEVFGCEVEWDNVNRIAIISSPIKEMTVIGFYALGDTNTSSWTNLFTKSYPEIDIGNTNSVSELAFGWYSLDEKGKLITDSSSGWRRPNGWEDILSSIEQFGLRTEMVVYLADGNLSLTSLLNNEEISNQAINDIVEEAKKFQGVNLDFEGLGFSDSDEQLPFVRESYVSFVRELSSKLSENEHTLTLTLHPLNGAYRGYDYKALGEYADKIIIMAYDYGTRPEPDSKVIEAIQMAIANVPSDKLVLGISAHSENGKSILNKIGIAKRYNLDGIAIWRLGLITNDMWESINKSLNAKKIENAFEISIDTIL